MRFLKTSGIVYHFLGGITEETAMDRPRNNIKMRRIAPPLPPLSKVSLRFKTFDIPLIKNMITPIEINTQMMVLLPLNAWFNASTKSG